MVCILHPPNKEKRSIKTRKSHKNGFISSLLSAPNDTSALLLFFQAYGHPILQWLTGFVDDLAAVWKVGQRHLPAGNLFRRREAFFRVIFGTPDPFPFSEDKKGGIGFSQRSRRMWG